MKAHTQYICNHRHVFRARVGPMSRPGVAKALDPRVAALLASGEEVGWVRPPPVGEKAALHTAAVAAIVDEEELTESEGGIVSDPEE